MNFIILAIERYSLIRKHSKSIIMYMSITALWVTSYSQCRIYYLLRTDLVLPLWVLPIGKSKASILLTEGLSFVASLLRNADLFHFSTKSAIFSWVFPESSLSKALEVNISSLKNRLASMWIDQWTQREDTRRKIYGLEGSWNRKISIWSQKIRIWVPCFLRISKNMLPEGGHKQIAPIELTLLLIFLHVIKWRHSGCFLQTNKLYTHWPVSALFWEA